MSNNGLLFVLGEVGQYVSEDEFNGEQNSIDNQVIVIHLNRLA